MTRRWAAHQDVEVTVITSLYDKSDLRAEGFITNINIEGVLVKLINVRLSNKDTKLKSMLSFIKFMLVSIWYALTLRYNVIICSSGPLTIGVPGILAKVLRRKKFVFEVRDLWPEGAISLGVLTGKMSIKLARGLEKLCYKSANLIVALSIGMRDNILSRFPDRRIIVIENASDIQLAEENNLAPETPIPNILEKKLILYTGTLGLMDDCAQIVHMAARLQQLNRDDIRVVLIGEGKEKNQIVELSEKLRLQNIHFLGLMPKQQVMRWLSVGAVSVLTLKEVQFLDTGSPNKLFDAFAAGIPTVQNTQGWIKDLLESSGAGLTTPRGDGIALADACLKIIDNDNLQQSMRIAAKKLAETKFNRDILAADMLHAIRGLAAS